MIRFKWKDLESEVGKLVVVNMPRSYFRDNVCIIVDVCWCSASEVYTQVCFDPETFTLRSGQPKHPEPSILEWLREKFGYIEHGNPFQFLTKHLDYYKPGGLYPIPNLDNLNLLKDRYLTTQAQKVWNE